MTKTILLNFHVIIHHFMHPEILLYVFLILHLNKTLHILLCRHNHLGYRPIHPNSKSIHKSILKFQINSVFRKVLLQEVNLLYYGLLIHIKIICSIKFFLSQIQPSHIPPFPYILIHLTILESTFEQ